MAAAVIGAAKHAYRLVKPEAQYLGKCWAYYFAPVFYKRLGRAFLRKWRSKFSIIVRPSKVLVKQTLMHRLLFSWYDEYSREIRFRSRPVCYFFYVYANVSLKYSSCLRVPRTMCIPSSWSTKPFTNFVWFKLWLPLKYKPTIAQWCVR